MPGMNSGLNPADPTHGGRVPLGADCTSWRSSGVIFLLLLLGWGVTSGWVTAGSQAARRGPPPGASRGRGRLLRVGFGILWVFDGILQAQPQMAAGLPAQVIEPAASSSPGWVQHLVNWGGTIWSVPPDRGGRRVGLDPGRDRRCG